MPRRTPHSGLRAARTAPRSAGSPRAGRARRRENVEALEPRRLLSAADAGLINVNDIPFYAGVAGTAADVNGTVYFARCQTASSSHVELWKTDGTPQGTSLVTTLPDVSGPSSTGYPPPVRDFAAVGNQPYFCANGQLWTSDGTAAGTHASSANITFSYNNSGQIVGAGGLAYVWSGSSTYGSSSYVTDGTSAGTHSFGALQPTAMFSFGGAAYAYDSSGFYALSASGGYGKLTSVAPRGQVVTAMGRMYFLALDYTSGTYGLWSSDGTSAKRVTTVGDAQSLTACGNALYFTVDGALWRSDGTAAGTGLLLDLIPGGFDAAAHLTAVGDTLYFSDRTSNGLDHDAIEAERRHANAGHLEVHRLEHQQVSHRLHLLGRESDLRRPGRHVRHRAVGVR